MKDKLEQIIHILESTFIQEGKEDSKDKENKEDKKDSKEPDKVDLEKELTDSGDPKADYSKDIIAVINGMIEGKNTIEDLEKVVKSKKNAK